MTKIPNLVPWTVDETIRENFTKELAVLDSKVEQIDQIAPNPSYFYYFILETTGLSYFFKTTSEQLHNLIDALVDAVHERVDIVNKTLEKIDDFRANLKHNDAFARHLESDYGKERGITSQKIWKALNTTVEGITDALRKTESSTKLSATLNRYLKTLTVTISDIQELVQSILVDIKLFERENSKNEAILNSTCDYRKMLILLDSKIRQCVGDLNNTTVTMNTTLLSSYKPMLKKTMIDNSSAVNYLLQKLNETVYYLQSIQPLFSTLFKYEANRLITELPELIHYFYAEGLDRHSKALFKNSTKFELCYRRQNPTIEQFTANFSKLVERCVLEQLDYLPNIVLMVKEFLGPYRDVAFSPVQSLKSCSITVGGKHCYADFIDTVIHLMILF